VIGNLLERATQDLRALKMSKRADQPPLTAASSDPSPAVGYGIPVAMSGLISVNGAYLQESLEISSNIELNLFNRRPAKSHNCFNCSAYV
jgi:hypothetical protein